MAARAGRRVTFTWGGAVVPGVREKGVSLNGESINVTSDEDDGWQTLLEDSSENNVEISLSGVTKNEALKIAWFSNDRIKPATLEYQADGGSIEGEFRLSTFSEGNPYNDASTFEATLQSTGPVTYTPYS